MAMHPPAQSHSNAPQPDSPNASATPVSVVTFYAFIPLSNPEALQAQLLEQVESTDLRGTLLLAHEGFNGTLAGNQDALEALLQTLQTCCPQAQIRPTWSKTEAMPFQRLKIKCKPEIVTMRTPEAQHPEERGISRGIHVSPQEWNAILQDPDVVVVDTRNDFEVQLGSFHRAENPKTKHFSDFGQYVSDTLSPDTHQKVAMFCTGGIRCEKASAYMMSQGFETVYQLEGGILNYLNSVPQEESLWHGECFVFDERVSLVHTLAEGTTTMDEVETLQGTRPSGPPNDEGDSPS